VCKQSNKQLFAQLMHDLMENNKCSIQFIAQGFENLKEKIKVFIEREIESILINAMLTFAKDGEAELFQD
jgi:hypothetical protein